VGIIGGADGPTTIYIGNTVAGAILTLLTSYFGLLIFGLIFCASLILLLAKRRTLKKWMIIILIILAIISFVFICSSVVLAALFGSGNAIVPVPVHV
jgi:Na+-transporting methylmalonyl-CoA/oxaloacetate decarboxylase beta subunit